MKSRQKKFMSLLEILVYMSVLLVVMALSYRSFYQLLKSSQSLTRAGDDILKISRIGDRWREDIRSANSIKLEDGVLSLAKEKGVIVYALRDGHLKCMESYGGNWKSLSDGIVSCEFVEIPHGSFSAWEMNIELRSDRKNAKVRPLFSFIAANVHRHPKNEAGK